MSERFCSGCGATMSADYGTEQCLMCERGLPRPRFRAAGSSSTKYSTSGVPDPSLAAFLTIAAIVIGPILGMALAAWLIWRAWP